MEKKNVIERLINIAEKEIGYLEKASEKDLDSFTANAGSGNYTKYWRDVKPEYQGQPWCAAFVTWVFDRTFGKEKYKEALKALSICVLPGFGKQLYKICKPQSWRCSDLLEKRHICPYGDRDGGFWRQI